jgi:hypothetical protein
MKAAGALPEAVKLRSSKYLNNTIEQDHRGVKARTGPMLGFKSFKTAAITLAGIELLAEFTNANSIPGCGSGVKRRPKSGIRGSGSNGTESSIQPAE